MRVLAGVLAGACAGPVNELRETSPVRPDAAAGLRLSVASTLTPDAPLEAKPCELPTIPGNACPEPEPEAHPHQQPRAPVTHSPTEPLPGHPAAHSHRTLPATPAPEPAQTRKTSDSRVLDPVCGMRIEPAKAAGSVTIKGVTTHFCSAICKRTFLARLDGGTP